MKAAGGKQPSGKKAAGKAKPGAPKAGKAKPNGTKPNGARPGKAKESGPKGGGAGKPAKPTGEPAPARSPGRTPAPAPQPEPERQLAPTRQRKRAELALAPAPAPAAEPALLSHTRTLLEAAPRSLYEVQDLARMKKSLGEHQAKCAQQMEKILNHQNLTLADVKLPQEEDAREPPLERLRRFMRQLQAARQRLDTPTFGLCEVCSSAIGVESLVQMPWADRCASCGAADSRLSARTSPS